MTQEMGTLTKTSLNNSVTFGVKVEVSKDLFENGNLNLQCRLGY